MDSAAVQEGEAVCVLALTNAEPFKGKAPAVGSSYLSHGGGKAAVTRAERATDEQQNNINFHMLGRNLKWRQSTECAVRTACGSGVIWGEAEYWHLASEELLNRIRKTKTGETKFQWALFLTKFSNCTQ